MRGMEFSEEDLAFRQLGKILFFLFVGALSAILLYVGWHDVNRDEPMGYLAFAGSALFWWPLFRLGRYHARKRPHA